MDHIVEEVRSSTINPPRQGRISFRKSAPRDTTYNLWEKYPIAKGSHSGSNKNYKTYNKRRLVDEIRTLSIANESDTSLNLAAWDPKMWTES